MRAILNNCAAALGDAGFSTRFVEIPESAGGNVREALAFENVTVLGFVIAYGTAAELIERWKADGDSIVRLHRDVLRAARQKAWNAYLILLSEEAASFEQSLALGQIEEDLEAMRKITKAGVLGDSGARAALLPLLPFRAAPVLDPIDMREEIASRSSELNADIVQAFLSEADENIVLQLLEDGE